MGGGGRAKFHTTIISKFIKTIFFRFIRLPLLHKMEDESEEMTMK